MKLPKGLAFIVAIANFILSALAAIDGNGYMARWHIAIGIGWLIVHNTEGNK